jgi:hypothetical protein
VARAGRGDAGGVHRRRWGVVHPERCKIVHQSQFARSRVTGLLTRVAAVNAAEHYGAGSSFVRPRCSRTPSR